MEFSVRTGSLETQRTDCLVVGVYEGGRHPFDDAVAHGDLDGKLGATLLLYDVPKMAAKRVLLVGLGREREFGEASYLTALSSAVKALRKTGAVDATISLDELRVKGRDDAWKTEHAVLAVRESLYRFDKLKTKPQAKRPLKRVVFRVGSKAALARGIAIADGIALAKDLANLPGNICTPTYLANQARDLGERHRFAVEILGRKDIEKLGMNAFAAVARGSREPPKLIVMEYDGSGRGGAPVVLVGKGITFDSGGLSIKPSAEMDEMKFDMCGAASVFGALHAAAAMKLPLDVVGIIPAAENMPGGDAMKPGDIVTTMSGQTVEILDTDHEGRLVLCDALTYAAKYKPSALIDVATLTDGIVTALGDVFTGLFANDEALAGELLDAGESAWDRAWRMPLADEYQDKLDSNFADFANIGPHAANAITAACFLSRFTKRFAWAHLDIAGTASKSGEHKGATGRPVALLAHFLARRAGA